MSATLLEAIVGQYVSEIFTEHGARTRFWPVGCTRDAPIMHRGTH